jgi:acetoacetate decarboxylase
MVHSRFMPRIEGDGADSYHELVTMSGRDVELGQAWSGDGEIDLHHSPVEELHRLEVREIIGGYFRQVGTTFAGGTTLEQQA